MKSTFAAFAYPAARRGPAVGALAACLLLHAAVWQSTFAAAPLSTTARPRAAPLQVRNLADAAARAEPAPEPVPPARPHRAAAQATRVAAAPAGGASAVESPPDPSSAAAPPVYRTRMPPAITLNYDMSRGALSGTGELVWLPHGSGYEAKLEGRVAGFSILSWSSAGEIDAHGLAPTRYTDQRRGKSMQAANFQRLAGKITFSGPSTEYPLLPGTQDRLSWMIQLAAIASAEPQRVAAGQRIAMFVAGAHGDADVWTFRVQGVEDVVTAQASTRAIKLLREPRKPFDTRVEVWLDPLRHYLPVRARLSNEESALELLLQSSQPAS